MPKECHKNAELAFNELAQPFSPTKYDSFVLKICRPMNVLQNFRILVSPILLICGTTSVFADDPPSLTKAKTAFVRTPDESVHAGMRIMVVDPADVTPSTEHAPSRVQIATIAKVTQTSGGELTILDDFGVGTVDTDNVIVLRRRDVFEQIARRIPASHQTLAQAEFASLYSMPKAWKLFIKAIDEQPDNQWFRARLAKFFADHKRFVELMSTAQELRREGRAAAVGEVVKSAVMSYNQKLENLVPLIRNDPKNTFARFAMMKGHADLVNSNLKVGMLNDYFLSMKGSAERIRTQVPFYPAASAVELQVSVRHFNRSGRVNSKDFRTALAEGQKSIQADPHNGSLLIALADGYREAGDLPKAGKYALSAVQKFPRNSESVACLLRCADARSSNPEINTFFEDYRAAQISEMLKLIDGIDIPSRDPLPPLRLVDGDGRIDIGYTVDEETQLTAYAVLCLNDACDCLRYLNNYLPAFDLTQANPEFHDLIAACCYSDSYHALNYIVSTETPTSGIDKMFEQAMDRDSKVCLWVLWKNGLRPSDATTEQIAKSLSVETSEIETAIGDAALSDLAKALPKVLEQASEMRKLGIAHERESRNFVSRGEDIARRQAVYGDRTGYAQTMEGVRQAKENVKEGRQLQEVANVLLVDNLEREFQVIESLLDNESKKIWFENLNAFIESKEQWMKEGRSRWGRTIKSEID